MGVDCVKRSIAVYELGIYKLYIFALLCGSFVHGLGQNMNQNVWIENVQVEQDNNVMCVEQFWTGERSNGSNKNLVEMLQTAGSLKSERVKNIMKQLDRGLFVPEGEDPYVDHPLPIGYNATISAPHMHAECLQLLEEHLQPGMHGLDVGSGTGYLTAAFALLVGEEGRTVGVEHIPELVEQSVVNVQRSKAAHLLASGRLSLHAGDGRKGCPELAPYDAIHVGAAADRIPQALIDQLKIGGRMVIPVGDIFQDLKVVDKKPDGTINEWTVTAVRYVPLTNRAAQLGRQ